jgi:hypothetical protein
MAMLPSAAQIHAPAALRHLMAPGSPVADVYSVCEECEALRLRAAELSKASRVDRHKECEALRLCAAELSKAEAGRQTRARGLDGLAGGMEGAAAAALGRSDERAHGCNLGGWRKWR